MLQAILNQTGIKIGLNFSILLFYVRCFHFKAVEGINSSFILAWLEVEPVPMTFGLISVAAETAD